MVEATALLPHKSVLEKECGRYGGHGRTGEKKIIFLLTATPGVCSGQLPYVLQHKKSISPKEQHG